MVLKRSSLFPVFNEPKSLTVLDIRPCSWDEQLTMTCIQGLINREEPRIYLVFDDYVDRLWLPIYRERYGVAFSESKNLLEIVSLFADELKSFVVYDAKMLHSANVAMTYGSIHNAVPASPSMADELSAVGLKKVADFRGKWRNRLEAYEWELENLMPECHKRIVGSTCVDPPYIANPTHHIRDYLVATKAFSFDLSTKIRDRKENELFDRILSRFPRLGVVLGWHCCRDIESEAVTRAAKNGFFVLCNLASPNLSVHAGIKTDWEFKQKHINKDLVSVENKVYVTFIQSDGDAIWALNNFQNRNWLDSQRGSFPYNWEIQPLILDLAPGILEYYYRTATPNDYFIAGPSGAGYTYPTPNKRLKEFLEQTKDYLKLCDLRSILIMNRDPRVCYQELDDAELPYAMINALADAMCFGFPHGYRGSGFVSPVFVNNVPYIHTAEHISSDPDVLKEITKFGEGCKTRPLFVCVHVRESTKMPSLRRAIDKLNTNIYKVVKLDEFMLTLQKAREERRFTEVFPEKEFLKESLNEQGRSVWETYYRNIARLEKIVNLEPDRKLSELNTAGYDFAPEQTADALGYEAIETMLQIVRLALNIRGIYVNYRDKSVKDFLKEYSDLQDADVVKDAYELWQNWEETENNLEDVQKLTQRVINLSKELDRRLFPQK
jgi:hypothetical protein